MTTSARVRPASASDLARLPAIERRAAERFASVGLAELFGEETTPIAILDAARADGRLWVAVTADDEPVGFVLVAIVDAAAHVEEIDVVPERGGEGLGSALLEAVAAWARSAGLAAMTLSTMADVAWNAPWYARRGFRALAPSELTPGLVARRRAEGERGFPLERRVVMRREL